MRTKNANMVVKLDMTKVYDILSWLFITKVFREFSFCEEIIDMVYRLLEDNRGT